MKPGFEFDRSDDAWRHGVDFWHHGLSTWFQIPPWGAVLGALAAVTLYFVPALTAIFRRHPNRVAILFLNALLGWTFFGWAIALVWASTSTKGRYDDPPRPRAGPSDPTEPQP